MKAELKKIMERKKTTRSSDILLFCEVATGIIGKNDAMILKSYLEVLPSFSTVSRARRKVQKDYPELNADEKALTARRKKEKKMRAEYGQ